MLQPLQACRTAHSLQQRLTLDGPGCCRLGIAAALTANYNL